MKKYELDYIEKRKKDILAGFPQNPTREQIAAEITVLVRMLQSHINVMAKVIEPKEAVYLLKTEIIKLLLNDNDD